jgi:hypothetical protein
LFAGRDAGLEELLIALRFEVVEFQLSSIACECGFGLVESCPKGTSIQGEKQVALLDEVTLPEMNFLKLGIHLRLNGNG